MRHSEEAALHAIVGSSGKELIEERNENGQALEREALGAEVALLDDLLEDVGADKAGEDAGFCGIGCGVILLELLLNPGALFGRGNVHELCADGTAIIFARFFGVSAVGCRSRKWFGRQILTERIERCL